MVKWAYSKNLWPFILQRVSSYSELPINHDNQKLRTQMIQNFLSYSASGFDMPLKYFSELYSQGLSLTNVIM